MGRGSSRELTLGQRHHHDRGGDARELGDIGSAGSWRRLLEVSSNNILFRYNSLAKSIINVGCGMSTCPVKNYVDTCGPLTYIMRQMWMWVGVGLFSYGCLSGII